MTVSTTDNDKPLCIGFGKREGRCLNDAGSTHSQIWCQECDDARRAHITAQLDKLSKFYEDDHV